MLLQTSGDVVCRTSAALALPGLRPQFQKRIEGRQVGGGYVWLVPVISRAGEPYEYVWFQPPPRRPDHRPSLLRYAFPQLPVAIAVGGLTTFALVLLFSRPLIRLRRAARALAEGDLAARVKTSPARIAGSHSDEFQGLTHDFNHMAERLESLVGAQRLLLRDVSHELRSPLSRLSVALELAREDAAPTLLPHLVRIEREGEKLNQLIGELLTLSSMESLESSSLFKEVSLNEVCEQLLPDAEYEAQRRPCTVLLKQEEECAIQGSFHLLHRAVENVVRNAIRYTEAGTQVTICVKRSHGCAVIEVTDCGPGIPEDQIENVLRPFYRLDYARSATTGGFGVGLAITDRAVKLHGGKVTVANRQRGGTCVEMAFD